MYKEADAEIAKYKSYREYLKQKENKMLDDDNNSKQQCLAI